MSDVKTIRPSELKAACEVLHYAFLKFPVLDGWDEEHHCAQVIATHTRHGGQTAEQLAARVKELKERLDDALAELEKENRECRSYQRNLADAQADIAGEVELSNELAKRITELESLASRLKEQRDTAPDKPSLWLCLNPYPEGGKPTAYHATLADAKAEAERLASKTGRKIHVVRIVGTACPPKPARWEER
jgi:DNA repair exonuclease SbcCD ATPase subunit